MQLKSILLFGMLTFTSVKNFAQDVIYVTSGTVIQCNIHDIDNRGIRYRKIENPDGPLFTLSAKYISLVFFENGHYVVLPASDPSLLDPDNYQSRDHDLLIMADGMVLEVVVAEIDNDNKLIKYHKLENPGGPVYSVGFARLAAIIFRTGRHALLLPPQKAIDALLIAQHHLMTTEPPIPKAMVATYEEQALPENESPIIQTPIVNKRPPYVLNDVSFEEFMDKAFKKINDLGMYLEIITNKIKDYQEVNSAIDLAVSLFINEEAIVEISSVNRQEKNSYPIRQYLNHLKLLKYDRVDISWADVNHVSDFRLGPDGNYYGTVSVQQRFMGIIDNKVVYGDITEKHIEVILKGYEKEVNGQANFGWDVWLSDIGVENTRRK